MDHMAHHKNSVRTDYNENSSYMNLNSVLLLPHTSKSEYYQYFWSNSFGIFFKEISSECADSTWYLNAFKTEMKNYLVLQTHYFAYKLKVSWIKNLFWGLYSEGQTMSLKSIFKKGLPLAELVSFLMTIFTLLLCGLAISGSMHGLYFEVCFLLCLLLGGPLGISLGCLPMILSWIDFIAHFTDPEYLLFSPFSSLALYWPKWKKTEER